MLFCALTLGASIGDLTAAAVTALAARVVG
jgi:hypothetical protein